MTKEEAIEVITDYLNKDTAISPYNRRFLNALNMAIEALQSEPVKYGKWTVDEKHTEEIYTNPVYCSACGKDVVMDYGEYAPYCPNCGAKMKID